MLEKDKNVAIETEIEAATKHFEKLLRNQLERVDRLDKKATKINLKNNESIIIGLCDGDGIGTTIMKAGRLVLENLLKEEIESKKIILKEISGLTIENRKQTGESVPKDVLENIRQCYVLVKGPTETPKGGSLESANVTLRRELDLYANIRPIIVEDEGIDWTFFRENTEGEYVLGSQGIRITDKLSMDFKVTSLAGTKRIAKRAFEYAVQNNKTKIAIVTKANIMKKTDADFSQICHEVAKDYPSLELKDYYIDIMAANLVNTKIRNDFEVFLLPNLYGDILTDEAAEIQGGVGTAGSINAGDNFAMFEAVHGTAPQLVEDGLAEFANPASIIKAIEIMLRYIGETAKADKLLYAINLVNNSDEIIMSGDGKGSKAIDYAEAIVSKIQ